MDPKLASCIAYLSGAMISALEVVTIEQRLAYLENHAPTTYAAEPLPPGAERIQ